MSHLRLTPAPALVAALLVVIALITVARVPAIPRRTSTRRNSPARFIVEVEPQPGAYPVVVDEISRLGGSRLESRELVTDIMAVSLTADAADTLARHRHVVRVERDHLLTLDG